MNYKKFIIFQLREEAKKLISQACELFSVLYLEKEIQDLFDKTKVSPLNDAAYAAFAIVTGGNRRMTGQITLENISEKCGIVNQFKIQIAKKKMEQENKEQGYHPGKIVLFFLIKFIFKLLTNFFVFNLNFKKGLPPKCYSPSLMRK